MRTARSSKGGRRVRTAQFFPRRGVGRLSQKVVADRGSRLAPNEDPGNARSAASVKLTLFLEQVDNKWAPSQRGPS